MDAEQILKAFNSLDRKLRRPLRLLMGGGGAMLLMYKHPSATADVDVVPQPYQPLSDFEDVITDVARELKLPSDWLNTHFTDFTYVLPETCLQRLRPYFKGKKLTVECFGPEDMIIMKCMAGRAKDRGHLRKLIRIPDLEFKTIEEHLVKMQKSGLDRADAALALLEELRDEMLD